MQKRLKWNAIGLELKIQTIKRVLKEELEKIPPDHLKKRKKLQTFLNEVQIICNKLKENDLKSI